MKTKIKKIGYAVAGAAMAMSPAVALAQWSKGFSNASSSGLPGAPIYEIIKNTMNWILAIVGFIGVIGFAIAGILYLTSAGDETRIEQAKKAMMVAILGVVVALLGFVIIKAIDAWLGAGSTI
jgi:hypothetical protein